jgi:hypothetical protein
MFGLFTLFSTCKNKKKSRFYLYQVLTLSVCISIISVELIVIFLPIFVSKTHISVFMFNTFPKSTCLFASSTEAFMGKLLWFSQNSFKVYLSTRFAMVFYSKSLLYFSERAGSSPVSNLYTFCFSAVWAGSNIFMNSSYLASSIQFISIALGLCNKISFILLR